jgi:endoglucanase
MIGVNLCGAEFGEKSLPGEYGRHYVYPSAKELDYYKSKGILLVRLPFRWERMQPVLNGELDPAELKRVEIFVAEIRKRDMKMMPEPHNFARYRGELIGSPEVPHSAFADFWRRFAGHFKDEPSIAGWPLVNEPHHTQSLWPAAAQAAVDAIRTVDREHPILIPGDGWSGAADWRKYNEDLWINDPVNRIVYECHLYFDADRSGRYVKSYAEENGSLNVGVERLKAFRAWLNERNAVGFVGEFGVPPDEAWLESLDVFVKHLHEIGMSGTYWAGGPWWGSYPLSIEPRNGEDRPQLKVLVK